MKESGSTSGEASVRHLGPILESSRKCSGHCSSLISFRSPCLSAKRIFPLNGGEEAVFVGVHSPGLSKTTGDPLSILALFKRLTNAGNTGMPGDGCRLVRGTVM